MKKILILLILSQNLSLRTSVITLRNMTNDTTMQPAFIIGENNYWLNTIKPAKKGEKYNEVIIELNKQKVSWPENTSVDLSQATSFYVAGTSQNGCKHQVEYGLGGVKESDECIESDINKIEPYSIYELNTKTVPDKWNKENFGNNIYKLTTEKVGTYRPE